jgi:ABC-type multidrug transport system ATPase subunit
MLCGLLRRDGGEAKAAIGLVPQDVALHPDLSGLENLRSGGGCTG